MSHVTGCSNKGNSSSYAALNSRVSLFSFWPVQGVGTSAYPATQCNLESLTMSSFTGFHWRQSKRRHTRRFAHTLACCLLVQAV